jgi:hypothetical protein
VKASYSAVLLLFPLACRSRAKVVSPRTEPAKKAPIRCGISPALASRMRTSLGWIGLLAACLLFGPEIARAADIAVFAPEISNLSAQDAEAVGGLVAQSYAAVSQRSLLAPAQTAPALQQAGDYPAAALQLGVKEYIRLSAVSAGQRLVITAGRYTADGRLIMQLRQTAESIEDAALAADSIARSLYSGVQTPSPIAQGPMGPIGPIAPPPREPKKDEMVYGFKTGVHIPFAKDASFYPAISLQFDGRLQMQHFFLEFGAGFLIPTSLEQDDYYDDYGSCPPPYDSTGGSCEAPKTNRGHIGGITAELGASYYLTDTNVSPYIGGGIIPRIVLAGLNGNREQEDVASMSVYAQVGLTFPRDRPTRFFVDLRIAQGILEQHLNNGRGVWPTEPALHAGFGW